MQVLWQGGGRWGLMSFLVSGNLFIQWICTGLVWGRPVPATAPAQTSPFDLRTFSSFLLAIDQVTHVRKRAVNYNQGIFQLLSECMSGKVISGALLIPQWWNVTDPVTQAGLDLHEYNRDQTEILRLQCQRPAGLYYLFFPADENEVLGEMSGLIWILSGVVLPSETLTGSQCLSSWQCQLEKQGMSGLGTTFLASLSHLCYLI